MERTRWWYVLVGIAVLNVIWSLVGVLSGERITVGPATVWILFGGSFLVLTLVFYYSLYQETHAQFGNQTTSGPRSRDSGSVGVPFFL